MFKLRDLPNLERSIADLDLSVRAEKVLLNNNILIVAQLLLYKESELLQMLNFGSISLKEVRDTISPFGFRLGMLHGYKDEVTHAGGNVIQFLKDKGLISVNVEAAPQAESPDSFALFLQDCLPEKLREGLRPEFVAAVVSDPAVRSNIEEVLTRAISSKLGLGNS